jgi:hypothetical protein
MIRLPRLRGAIARGKASPVQIASRDWFRRQQQAIINRGSESSLCNLYLFKSTDPGSLELGSPFTGNLRVKIRAASEAGINPAIVAGRQGSFTLNNDPVNDATHVQYEIEAVALTYIVDATFDGVVAYAKDGVWYDVDMGAPTLRWFYDFDGVGATIVPDSDIVTVTGESVKFGYTSPSSAPAVTEYVYDVRSPSAGDSRQFLKVTSSGNWDVRTTFADYYVDGLLIADNDIAPLDGLMHYIEIIPKISGEAFPTATFMSRYDGMFNARGTVSNITIGDGSIHNYNVDDGPTAGGVVTNSGSGADATLANEITGDWYEAPV